MSAHPDQRKRELLGERLKQVSRSFYLSLRWLPRLVREPISLAYLLARTSDTIADTAWIPASERLETLDRFAARVTGADSTPLHLADIAKGQGDKAEGTLLERVEESLALLNQLTDIDQRLVRRVLETIISGQTLDVRRFATASESDLASLETADELEDYTYRVAGCVGEFWTGVCWTHLFPRPQLSEFRLNALGRRYGQGLQLINILRDLPRDLRQGRCYLPAEKLRTVGLEPHDLLDPRNETTLRPLYDALLTDAAERLGDGWLYTNAYPRMHARIRISCALPLLIGWRTINRLRTNPILDPHCRVKVSRHEVKGLMLRAVLTHPLEMLWQRLGN